MTEINKLRQRRNYLINRIGEGIVKSWDPNKMLAIVLDLNGVEDEIKKQGHNFKPRTDEIFTVEYWEGKCRLAGKLGKARASISALHEATSIPQNIRAYYIVKMVYSAKVREEADRAQQLMNRYLNDEWSAVHIGTDSNEEGGREVNTYQYRVSGTEDDMLKIEAVYNYFSQALQTYEPGVKSEGIWCVKL